MSRVTEPAAVRRKELREIKITISAEVGKGSVNHNSRKFKAANVDGDRSHLNIDYCNESIRRVYHELFDDALKRYNEKQTRSDRCIKDYYEKIRTGKQEKPFHELILQVGNKDDMSATGKNADMAKAILDEYYQGFQKRNPNLRVFSAHLHMDEAAPHLHIDFIPFTMGSKRGLETRVSLKQALAAQGFRGGTRSDTEWNQWVLSEKKELSNVMTRYNIEWEQKGTHEEHLSVMDFKKQERMQELQTLDSKIIEKQDEVKYLQKQTTTYKSAVNKMEETVYMLNSPEYQLPEPPALMTAKTYKAKFADRLVAKLKKLAQTFISKYFDVVESYNRVNRQNGLLYRENDYLQNANDRLSNENSNLREQNKDYALLRKVFGNKQIDALLEQAHERQIAQRNQRHRNSDVR